MTDDEMQSFANWTNLSETTFLLTPSSPEADYKLRIFTPFRELPFAGHPTLGSAFAWVKNGGVPKKANFLVQECAIGLLPIQYENDSFQVKAPALKRSGPLEEETFQHALEILGLAPEDIVASNWIENGPPWIGLVLHDANAVLNVQPNMSLLSKYDLFLGIIGPHKNGNPADFEVRAFAENFEDPVCGSLNAAVATWLICAKMAPPTYSVRQGTMVRRQGNVGLSTDENQDIWLQGRCAAVIEGKVNI
ncbi:hypothetical protein ACI68E_004143 [Malassezia pachydermatis]|uniref:Phenazine biosynthesis protein n=1 Tax=Malassezia pachydermatis TaxID=77020 RepID=A0A0M8MTS8_9BASI|nr:phenazine biosynthesis protein [Malassezia pachydermatis]KOS13650.1 phenazine biosynthesis protein [Malassezia pachydermatis]